MSNVREVVQTTVIRVLAARGDGTMHSPFRTVTEYWSLDGKKLADDDQPDADSVAMQLASALQEIRRQSDRADDWMRTAKDRERGNDELHQRLDALTTAAKYVTDCPPGGYIAPAIDELRKAIA